MKSDIDKLGEGMAHMLLEIMRKYNLLLEENLKLLKENSELNKKVKK